MEPLWKYAFTLIFIFCATLADGAVLSPSPKKDGLKGPILRISPESTITVGSEVVVSDVILDALRSAIGQSSVKGSKVNIAIHLFSDEVRGSVSDEIAKALGHKESYYIHLADDRISIFGGDRLGLIHGITCVEKLIRSTKGEVRQGTVVDWPDLQTRAFHILVRGTSAIDVKHTITSARLSYFNTLILLLADGVKLQSMKQIAATDAWEINDLISVVDFARANGIEVVPEIKLLSHQDKLLKNIYPHLMFNKSTYDPRLEETYELVFAILDEVFTIVKPTAIHIGHDEVAGHSEASREKWLNKGEMMLPPDLYLMDILKLHRYLAGRNIKVWMWGDMLLAPKEFPNMPAAQLHGGRGYSELRPQIPKDVVICDWHYFGRNSEFPTAQAFANAGHKVLGATFWRTDVIENFSRYMAQMPVNGEGMIATTWGYVPKGDLDKVENIIQASGEAFWNAK